MKVIRDIILSVNQEPTDHTIFVNDNGEQATYQQSETRAKDILESLGGKALIPASEVTEIVENGDSLHQIHDFEGLGITVTVTTYKGGQYQ